MNIDKFIQTLSPEQIEALKLALTNTRQAPAEQEPIEEDKNSFQMKRSVDNNRKRKEAVRAKGNTWSDTGEKRDVVTPEFTPVPRNREAPEKVKIKCHICGKTTEVDSRFVCGEFYRCNNCTG
jgi:hypothetical protein